MREGWVEIKSGGYIDLNKCYKITKSRTQWYAYLIGEGGIALVERPTDFLCLPEEEEEPVNELDTVKPLTDAEVSKKYEEWRHKLSPRKPRSGRVQFM